MDRKLNYSNDSLKQVRMDFYEIIRTKKSELDFVIWKLIPDEYAQSFYENEQKISPNKMSFEEWYLNSQKVTKPIYSVALINDSVISSIGGGQIPYEQILNLWYTNELHRGQSIGKGVLLNFIKHVFENDISISIKALDVTSQSVDNILLRYGFQ